MIGKVTKIHSDFYYVKTNSSIFECKIREILKKSHVSISVGDNVELDEINTETSQAVIFRLLERINFIPRPAVANLDQLVIVSTLKQPDFDFKQLNRYLCFAKLHNIQAVICINKSDLSHTSDEFEKIKYIYNNLGYKVLYTSALENQGIEEFEWLIQDKTTALAGASGVGKSSLINTINPKLNLKTKKVSSKTNRGTHTTRHSEIIEINLENGKTANIVDTPGFSQLKFNTIMPKEVEELFDDIKNLAQDCYFNDCLHKNEKDCNVLENLETLGEKRYESYLEFLEEALEYKEKISQEGLKEEEKVKTKGNKKIVKLGTKAREKSKRQKRQELTITSLNDIELEEYDN